MKLDNVYIVLVDKVSKQRSLPFSIETFFDHGNEIEFEPDEDGDYCALPVKDFFFFSDHYEIQYYDTNIFS
jgi:hypothetical protein